MADTIDTSALDLSHHFPPVSTQDWEALIHEDLRGADYEQRLVWKTEEGIAVRPYYRSGDAPVSEIRPAILADWTVVPSGSQPPSGAIRADEFHEQGATAVQELAFAIAAAVERIAAEGGSVEFVFAIGTNYFFEIAKLRAARLLWARVADAFGMESRVTRIHARTSLSGKSIYDPYTNLLRATTEALSAAVGGCDSLEVQAFRFAPRLADNLQYILKEEAHIGRVADPAGGCYYVEALTESLARESWKLFQQVESLGGFAPAQKFVSDAIAASRAAREKAVAARRKVLVGVNNYPDPEETAGPQPVPSGIWRECAVFEQIRRRAEDHSDRTGRRPKALLLLRGDLKMRQARAQFIQNLLGCGGFAIEESDSYEHTDADLIVLCSSDSEYPGIAVEVCPKAAVPVIVAGNPKHQLDALNAAGVAGYIHILSDAVETLTYWQDRLGIGR